MSNSNSNDIPDAAVQVLRDFVAAGKRADAEAMKACLTKASVESGAFRAEQPPGVDFIVGEAVRENGEIVVPLKVVPEGTGPDAVPLDELACLIVEEEGAWKFDLATTVDRKMGGMQAAMEQAMSQMGEAMAGAMSGIGEAMQEAFGSGGEEGDGRTSWDDVADPDPEMLTPVRETVELPKTRAAVSEVLGFDVPVRVDIAGFMRHFGVDEPNTLLNWFDDQLLANWGALVAPVKRYMPLEERLTGIRFEPAASSHDRFLAMDGGELLYRLDPRVQEGFYSDNELAAILMPLLGGAARHGEFELQVPGRSFFPAEDAITSFDDYVPIAHRWMKRISELLGRFIALSVDWGEVNSVCYTSKPLYAWGLNRVYGGIAAADVIWAPGDTNVRYELDSLHTVRFRAVYTPEERAAFISEGVLHVAVALPRDDAGGLYEHEIAGAFTGKPVLPVDGSVNEMPANTEAAGVDPEVAASMEAAGSDSGGELEGVDMSDPYAVAGAYMDRLETALQGANMWPGDAPEPLEIRGAFGRENMAYEQWLGWVLIPNVRRIVAQRGQFPSSSSAGAYAVREFDGRYEAESVVSILCQFDAYIEGLAEGAVDL